ncbi:hypothetical protein [Streptomyces sp. NPDC047968]|uniref:hypothetical protein n=1 Tax=unclassified Streptomyces TaxID=2593676 RepID=UPI003449C0A3
MGASLPARATVMLEVDGTDEDITQDVRVDPGITVSRAARSETDQVADAGSASLTLDNRQGRYSVLDPESALWGKIGRNTPIKIGYAEGGSYLDIQDNVAFAYTYDTTDLNVTGDLDVRVDAQLDNWASPSNAYVLLAGKYSTISDQRSWFLAVQNGRLALRWSEDGTGGTLIERGSTIEVPLKAGRRLAVRAVLDVDNGAGGYTLTFYTAPRMPLNDDDWVQLGDPVVGSSTTSIYASTAFVQVGHAANLGFDSGYGQYYRVAYYDGASLVRDVDFTTVGELQAPSVFQDLTARGWAFFAGARTSTYKPRMAGEVASWQPARHLSGNDATVSVDVGGILRRIARSSDPVASVLRREVTAAAITAPVAYWPMEDGSRSTQIEAVFGTDAAIIGSPDMASFDGFDCSDPIPVLKEGAYFHGTVPAHAATTEYQIRWIMYPDATGATNATVLRAYTSGGVARWDVRYEHPNVWRVYAYDGDGVELASGATAFTITSHQNQLRLSLEIQVDGSDIDYQLVMLEVGNPVGEVGAGGTVSSVSMGAVTGVKLALGQAVFDGSAVGHLAVYSEITSIFDLYQQVNAWRGEAAGSRIKRLCEENGVAFSSPWDEFLADTTLMDGQRSDSLANLLEECATAGQGLLVENRHEASLCFIPPFALEGQEPTVVLDYSAGMIAEPFEPVVDDKLTVNAFTATRRDGVSYVSEVTSGRLSTQAPPDGVGRTPGSGTFSLHTDEQTAHIAMWRTHLGTYEGVRYTTVSIKLGNERAHQLLDDLLRLDSGHLMRLKNVPREHGPDDVDLLVWGVEDVSSGSEWALSLICVPADPWRTLALDVPGRGRLDTAGSQLAEDLTAGETDVDVATTSGPVWIDSATHPGEFPFDVRVGGEVMTVTAISGTSSPQTFTVTRSVNGVTKTHDTGTGVRLAYPTTIAL